MDLTTKYLGLKLRSPLVVSASPLSEDIDNIKRMEDAGASAVVFTRCSRNSCARTGWNWTRIWSRARKVSPRR